MKKKQFDKLNFEIEILPSGKTNLKHKEKFKINGLTTICNRRGVWTMTSSYPLDETIARIDTLEFIEENYDSEK
jgi:hypothetical protein